MLQFLENYVTAFLTVTCIFVALFYLASCLKETRGLPLPPGPIGLPIVGYLPFVTKMQYLKFVQLASKYGNVFSLRLGSHFVVVLNTAEVIKEAFSKPEFLGRPPNNIFSLAKHFESPIYSSERKWLEQRRFAMRTMKDLGLGKSWMEKQILEEIQHFLEIITKSDGMPINITDKLTPSMSNNICSLVFGQRYRYDDPQRIFLDETLESVVLSIQHLSPRLFLSWLKKFPFSGKIFKTALFSKRVDDLRTFMRKRIEQHEKTLDPNNVRDFIDGYLNEMKTRLEKDPRTVFSHNMLTGSVINFFIAGSETVRTTVTWCLYAMAAHQDLQKKVQDEIDEIIGKERIPSWLDHNEMPFTEAVVAEVQRWKVVAPVGIPRYTTGDAELQGYHIPKGTIVVANIYSAHYDPEKWENPKEFKPDRFLSDDRKSVIKPDSWIPFSTGKRSCPGEILASIEVFLYITSILQRFAVDFCDEKPVDFGGVHGMTYQPKLHMLSFKRRA